MSLHCNSGIGMLDSHTLNFKNQVQVILCPSAIKIINNKIHKTTTLSDVLQGTELGLQYQRK